MLLGNIFHSSEYFIEFTVESTESLDSDQEEMTRSISSIPSNPSFQIPTIGELPAQDSFSKENERGLRKRSGVRKEYKSEFYSWWDDEIEDHAKNK